MRSSALLEPIVELRLALQGARDPGLRADLRHVEVALRRQLGPSIPKRVAARLLGVSVTALDRWIDRGRVPVVMPANGARRLGVETLPLLELATSVATLRRAGRTRGVVSEALEQLGRRDRGQRLVVCADVARLPRPNVSLDELQQQFRQTTPESRVLQLAALNDSLNRLATRGRG